MGRSQAALWCRRVLVAEGIINTVTALLMLFRPDVFLAQLGVTDGVNGAHLGITQQLGSIILILAYIL